VALNAFLVAAGFAAIALLAAHSLLGEKMIFKRLAEMDAFTPTNPRLSTRHWRALRASWHLVSVLGLGFAAALFAMAQPELARVQHGWVLPIIASTFVVGAAYWIIATRGKHPGWIGLLLIAGLVWWS
jgi:hypothetical protein